MKATVNVKKSFSDETEFSKNYENGDFEEFFNDEGKYLDKLAMVALTKGKDAKGELFKITFTVTVEN